jgi:hypothetical protein
MLDERGALHRLNCEGALADCTSEEAQRLERGNIITLSVPHRATYCRKFLCGGV